MQSTPNGPCGVAPGSRANHGGPRTSCTGTAAAHRSPPLEARPATLPRRLAEPPAQRAPVARKREGPPLAADGAPHPHATPCDSGPAPDELREGGGGARACFWCSALVGDATTASRCQQDPPFWEPRPWKPWAAWGMPLPWADGRGTCLALFDCLPPGGYHSPPPHTPPVRHAPAVVWGMLGARGGGGFHRSVGVSRPDGDGTGRHARGLTCRSSPQTHRRCAPGTRAARHPAGDRTPAQSGAAEGIGPNANSDGHSAPVPLEVCHNGREPKRAPLPRARPAWTCGTNLPVKPRHETPPKTPPNSQTGLDMATRDA